MQQVTDERSNTEGLPAHVRRYMRRLEAAMRDLEDLENIGDRLERSDRHLQWVKLIWRSGPTGDVLGMVKVLGTDGGPEIAYVGEESPVMVLAKLMKEVRNGELRWQPDKFHDYAGDKGGNSAGSGSKE